MRRTLKVSKGLGRQNRQVVASRWKNCSESCRQIKRLSQGEHMLICLSIKETMEDHQSPVADKPAPRRPWSKCKLVDTKLPLRPSHVWSIRTKLQMQGRQRDLALFNPIDSKLWSCDVVAIRVGGVAPSGYAMGPCDGPARGRPADSSDSS